MSSILHGEHRSAARETIISQMLLTTAGDVLKGMLSEANLVKAALAVVGLLFGLLIKKPLEDWWKNRGSLRQIRKDLYSAIADIENALAIYTTKLAYIVDKFGAVDPQIAMSLSAKFLDDFNKTIYAGKYAHELAAVQAARGKIRGEAESFERVMQGLADLSSQGVPAFAVRFHQELRVGHFDPKLLQSAGEERARLDTERLLREAVQAIDAATQARDKILKS
jgi:hypothetical protein